MTNIKKRLFWTVLCRSTSLNSTLNSLVSILTKTNRSEKSNNQARLWWKFYSEKKPNKCELSTCSLFIRWPDETSLDSFSHYKNCLNTSDEIMKEQTVKQKEWTEQDYTEWMQIIAKETLHNTNCFERKYSWFRSSARSHWNAGSKIVFDSY